jgi:hypothetical protein
VPADSALCCAKTLLPECHPVGARVLSDIRRALVPSPRLQPTEPQGSVSAPLMRAPPLPQPPAQILHLLRNQTGTLFHRSILYLPSNSTVAERRHISHAALPKTHGRLGRTSHHRTGLGAKRCARRRDQFCDRRITGSTSPVAQRHASAHSTISISGTIAGPCRNHLDGWGVYRASWIGSGCAVVQKLSANGWLLDPLP